MQSTAHQVVARNSVCSVLSVVRHVSHAPSLVRRRTSVHFMAGQAVLVLSERLVVTLSAARPRRCDQPSWVANEPVCRIPWRSSMTLRSWGLLAVAMASANEIRPAPRRVARDWSNVTMP